MEQHNKYQHESADTDSRHRFEFVWNPGEQRWNIGHRVAVRSRHCFTSLLPLL
jgi:hypothetical protein